ncbi:hypothetical protein [Arsenophonus nasoniae]|uniref:Uncharacterized protein n=1 Tax=Arsenophonus nasoniae TaxID=638 RepID=A0AA95GD70_9GAMM|nr:hypothetical protein [Arsenophonus nasoniae]WGL94015.1 hypothetical protein QE207_01340 [Arsenophonus nasoniae]
MNNSTFRVLVCEAPKHTIVLFSRLSHNLTLRQRARILNSVRGW